MRQFFITLLVAVGLIGTAAHADDRIEAEEIVSDALFTMKKMVAHERHGPMIRETLTQAKAIAIFPTILKGGFIIGAEGGRGILLAKAANGEWSYPGFYTIGSGSVGLQIGAASSELMLILTTGKALESFMKDRVSLGGELNAAAGTEGFGIQAGATTALEVDVRSFALSEGAFIGGGVEGSVVSPSPDYNNAFYGVSNASSEAIILEAQYRNAAADPLRRFLQTMR